MATTTNQNFLSKISAVCKPCDSADFHLDHLSWLPSYLSNSEEYLLEPCLNTILVFARARTSTLQSLYSWNKLEDFTRHLNLAADSSGASHHQIELVRRGPMTFFVTCSNSPRFNWNISLTHCDVGRNLDYFAPGHIRDHKERSPDTEYIVYFIENNSLKDLTAEIVLPEYMKDEETWKEFRRFNQVRENLFNATMEALGLDYRFKCVIISPGIESSIRQVMENPLPPSPSWWEDYCLLVNGFGLLREITNIEFTFCGFETKYQTYWPLLQLGFSFIMKFKRHEYIKKYIRNLGPIENVLSRIKSMTEDESPPESLDKILSQFTHDLDEAVKSFDMLVKNFQTGAKHSISSHLTSPTFMQSSQRVLRNARYKLRSAKDFVYLQVFERHKLKNRLLRPGIGCPISGDMDAFKLWKKVY